MLFRWSRNCASSERTIGTRNIFVYILALCLGEHQAADGCGGNYPKVCFCNSASKIINCSRRGLTIVPTEIPNDSVEFNLNGNSFSTPVLQRRNFSTFVNLEQLFMSECGVEWIQVDAFRDMVKLRFLDLSSNRIREIQDSTFSGLNLQFLYLNDNRQIRLSGGSFVGLSTTGLYLHDCALRSFAPEVAAPLNNTLRNLWLHGNSLEKLTKSLLPVFSTLAHLRLESNPLHCNCETAWLKDLHDSSPEVFHGGVAPSCFSPVRLRGKFFNNLAAQDFNCLAPTFSNIDAHFDAQHGRLKCTASGDPAPTLYWIRPSGETKKFSRPSNEEIHFNEGLLSMSANPTDGGSASISGMYICIATNDAGNVTLTVNVSWPTTKTLLGTPSSSGGGMSYNILTHPPEAVNSAFLRTLQPPAAKLLPTSDTKRAGTKAKEANSDEIADLSSSVDEQSQLDSNGSARYPQGLSPPHRAREGRFFTLPELVGAVVGTHLCTLVLCLVFIPLYFKRRWEAMQERRHHRQYRHQGAGLTDKTPPYLDNSRSQGVGGRGPASLDYFDYPSASGIKR